jgi:hypothetical protein
MPHPAATPRQVADRDQRLAAFKAGMRAEIVALYGELDPPRHPPAGLGEWNAAALIELVIDLRAATGHLYDQLRREPGSGLPA